MFETVTFPGGYQVQVLERMARCRNHEEHERAFLVELIDVLERGDTVYDVGAEEGVFSALVASIVGGGNVHLFEPAAGIWPNIKATWEANVLAGPGGCWNGFVGNVSTDSPRPGWPPEVGGQIQSVPGYPNLTERPDIPRISLDDYADWTVKPPDVVMMDVEGAEGLVVQGMRRLISRDMSRRPIVFISIHPHQFYRCYLKNDAEADWPSEPTQESIFREFARVGYVCRFLGVDHESHWQFVPAEDL